MKASTRRWLLALGALVALVVLLPVTVLAVTFGGLEASVDGAELPGGARLIRGGVSNLYLVPAGNGVVLVDCGNEREGAAIRAELKRRGLGDDAVKAIFITHGHRDHLGGCSLFPKAAVYALAEEVPVIEGAAVARGPVPRWRSPATDLGTRVSHPLRDGDTVRVGDVSVRALHVRGHTAGSAAYLINGVLYVGDSAAVERGGTLRRAAWIFSDDQHENLESMRELARRLEPERAHLQALACGHSGPSRDASPLFRLLAP
jgi:glyoxylase-like metal-dependent hydrolase (beta-lactamase superfamily II)